MEFNKNALRASVAVAVALCWLSEAFAEISSWAVTPAGTATLSGTSTSASWAVRKRSNVRTVRQTVSTGSVSTTSDTAAVGTATTKSALGEAPSATTVKKSVRGSWAYGTASGSRSISGSSAAKQKIDENMAAGLAAGFWAMAGVFNAIWIIVTVFFGFCLYKIATKLGEPHAWLGFIPYVQTYTFVKCGGKSGWWILWITIGYAAFLIPGIILTVIVMHGISKRYGRWAGTTALFFFFPYVMLPVLAFSEPKIAGTDNLTGYSPSPAAMRPAAASVAPVQSEAPSASMPSSETPETPVAASSIFTPETPAESGNDAARPVIQESVSEVREEPNPIVKEAEKIVDEGPGFKLPGA